MDLQTLEKANNINHNLEYAKRMVEVTVSEVKWHFVFESDMERIVIDNNNFITKVSNDTQMLIRKNMEEIVVAYRADAERQVKIYEKQLDSL